MRHAKNARRTVLASAVAVSSLLLIASPAAVRNAAAAQVFYVAPNGSDSAAGTQAAPWASIAHAQSVARPGDTVFFRGGTYAYTHADSTCSSQTANVDAITLSKSGTSGNLIS